MVINVITNFNIVLFYGWILHNSFLMWLNMMQRISGI